MLVDIHGHVGHLGSHGSTPEELTAYLDQCGLGYLLISNLGAASHHFVAPNEEETPANLATLEACRADRRLAPLYWVRLGQRDSSIHAFMGAIDVEPFVGAFFSPVLNGFEADARELSRYMNALSRFRRPAVFLTSGEDQGHPERVYRLARRHPRVPFILCGAGGDMHWGETIEVLKESRKRDDAQLFVASGRAAAADILDAIKMLGSDRVLLGTDAACLGPRHGERTNNVLEHLRAELPPDDFANFSGEMALALFRILDL